MRVTKKPSLAETHLELAAQAHNWNPTTVSAMSGVITIYLSSDQRVGGSTSLSAPIIADVKHCHSAFEVNQTCNSGRLAQINLWEN